jgi:hypothetical protein
MRCWFVRQDSTVPIDRVADIDSDQGVETAWCRRAEDLTACSWLDPREHFAILLRRRQVDPAVIICRQPREESIKRK